AWPKRWPATGPTVAEGSATGRVAYLTGEYPRATDTWMQREVAALRRAGTEVDFYAVRRPGDDHMVGPEQRTERERTTYLYPLLRPGPLARAHLGLAVASPRRYLRALALQWRTRRPGLKGSLYQLVYFLEAGLLAHRVRARGIDHLHNHLGDSSATVAMLAAELGGFGFSLTLHGPGIFFEPHTWRLDEKLARCRFCACISYFCRSQAAIFAPADRLDRLNIVHCGVDPSALRPVTHEGTGGRLLFVARLAELKGLSVLLEALVDLVERHPSVQLTVVGDGPERARFEALANRLGLDGSVSFVGYRSQAEVAEHLAETDVFVLPSYAEGVPVTLMEALGSGVPVVATQVGGVSELVEHGANGFIVRPGDEAELADRLGELVADPELRQRFGEHGRCLVVNEFDNDTEAARLATLFHSVGSDRRPALRPAPAPAIETPRDGSATHRC
ncbi:MAG: glycosyltransferase, partial [Actinomycetota bacterium]